MASLNQVFATFYTHGARKRADTTLSVFLDRSGFAVAGERSITDAFDRHTTSPTYPLTVFMPLSDRDIQGSTIVARIDPSSDDEAWEFDCELRLAFDNGAEIIRRFANVCLNEDSRTVCLQL